jgi:hypothetical protein
MKQRVLFKTTSFHALFTLKRERQREREREREAQNSVVLNGIVLLLPLDMHGQGRRSFSPL